MKMQIDALLYGDRVRANMIGGERVDVFVPSYSSSSTVKLEMTEESNLPKTSGLGQFSLPTASHDPTPPSNTETAKDASQNSLSDASLAERPAPSVASLEEPVVDADGLEPKERGRSTETEAEAASEAAAKKKKKKGFFYSDLRYEYDPATLRRFYENLMVPNFGMFSDELEELELWYRLLEQGREDDGLPTDNHTCLNHNQQVRSGHHKRNHYKFHILLAFEEGDDARQNIAAGCVVEYYETSNAGSLSYIVVSEDWRRRGLGGFLVNAMFDTLNRDAIGMGHKKCRAVFLETNSADKVGAEMDIMDPRLRHDVLERLGFLILNFDYVQPPVSPNHGKCWNLVLAVHKSACDEEEKHGVSSELLRGFIREMYEVIMGEENSLYDQDLLAMMKDLESKPVVSVRS